MSVWEMKTGKVNIDINGYRQKWLSINDCRQNAYKQNDMLLRIRLMKQQKPGDYIPTMEYTYLVPNWSLRMCLCLFVCVCVCVCTKKQSKCFTHLLVTLGHFYVPLNATFTKATFHFFKFYILIFFSVFNDHLNIQSIIGIIGWHINGLICQIFKAATTLSTMTLRIMTLSITKHWRFSENCQNQYCNDSRQTQRFQYHVVMILWFTVLELHHQYRASSA